MLTGLSPSTSTFRFFRYFRSSRKGCLAPVVSSSVMYSTGPSTSDSFLSRDGLSVAGPIAGPDFIRLNEGADVMQESVFPSGGIVARGSRGGTCKPWGYSEGGRADSGFSFDWTPRPASDASGGSPLDVDPGWCGVLDISDISMGVGDAFCARTSSEAWGAMSDIFETSKLLSSNGTAGPSSEAIDGAQIVFLGPRPSQARRARQHPTQ